MNGFAKLPKSIATNGLLSDIKALAVYACLLVHAAYEPRENKRYGYTLEAGDCDLTIDQVAEATQLTRNEVRGALARLDRYELVKSTDLGTNKRRLWRLIDSEKMESEECEATDFGTIEAPKNHHRSTIEPPKDHQRTTILKEVKKLRSKEVKKEDDVALALEAPDALKGLERFESDAALVKGFDEWLMQMHELYPLVDLKQEIKEAHQWLRDNPTKRRSKFKQFLRNWFKNTQDSLKKKGAAPQPAPEPWPPPMRDLSNDPHYQLMMRLGQMQENEKNGLHKFHGIKKRFTPEAEWTEDMED